MAHQEQSIVELVKQLPEVYQPIFKHPEFTAQASRSCLDRLEIITSVYDYLSKEKERPLKVLDLGCAQGFFSLNLAERGAIVTAVDYSQPNVNVCNKLAEENNGFNVEFLLGSIETIIQERVKEQEYDLVLGLSVFHHLVYEHGAEYVFDLFKMLSKKVETGIFEFALNTEPLYWASSQPEDPRTLIESYTFSHHLSMYGTHLSTVERPLFFASNKYWNIDKHYGVIDHFMRRSHQLDNFYHGNNRRYYFTDDKIIKIFLKNTTNSNYLELMNESVFLKQRIPGFRATELLHYGSNEWESWLVRTAVPGRLLQDVILAGDEFDDENVITGILEQVSILEAHGLYHNDLRPWNILLGDDGQIYLIDYGSISNYIADGDDLYGQILSFLFLIKEIAQNKIKEQGSQRPRFISPHDFPEKYKKWMTKVWMQPSQHWSFKNISSAYFDPDECIGDIPVSSILESYLSTTTNHMDWQAKQLQNVVIDRTDMFANHIRTANQDLVAESNNHMDWQVKQLQDVVVGRTEMLANHICTENQVLIAESKNKEDEYFNSIKKLSEKMDALIDSVISEQNARSFSYSDIKGEIHKEITASFIDEINTQKKMADELRNELNLVYGCNSWKITYPLRIVSKSIKLFFQPRKLISGIKLAAKKKGKNLVSMVNTFVSSRPLLRQRLVRILNRHPVIKHKIKRSLLREYNEQPSIYVHDDVVLPENHSGNTEQEQTYNVKKMGVHEKQKSVLESWLY